MDWMERSVEMVVRESICAHTVVCVRVCLCVMSACIYLSEYFTAPPPPPPLTHTFAFELFPAV